jgi:hypothetical protein
MGDGSWSIGWSANWVNFDVARRVALKQCRSFAESEEVRSRCAIITDIHRQCVAVAKRGPSEFGLGWGIDPNLESARQKALDMCQSVPGENNGDPCIIVVEDPNEACDRNDRGR